MPGYVWTTVDSAADYRVGCIEMGSCLGNSYFTGSVTGSTRVKAATSALLLKRLALGNVLKHCLELAASHAHTGSKLEETKKVQDYLNARLANRYYVSLA